MQEFLNLVYKVNLTICGMIRNTQKFKNSVYIAPEKYSIKILYCTDIQPYLQDLTMLEK